MQAVLTPLEGDEFLAAAKVCSPVWILPPRKSKEDLFQGRLAHRVVLNDVGVSHFKGLSARKDLAPGHGRVQDLILENILGGIDCKHSNHSTTRE